MTFPKEYKVLRNNEFSQNEYAIVPIRFEDRYDIMQWRNEQIYHLRQAEPLTKEAQDRYFKNIVSQLFDQDQPNQILFSYLKDGACIGYGGLVHINWIDKHAEISFIMKTELEKEEFKTHWGIYLDLIEQVAFPELKLHKIFTYAFDIRPHLYDVLEEKHYSQEAVLKEHCLFEGKYIDVIIHSKFITPISIREVSYSDLDFTYLLSNDPLTRTNSYNSEAIPFKNHEKWFQSKLKNTNALYFIGQFNRQPAAFIRIDLSEKENIIGITLHKDFRGKGLSSTYLKTTIKEFKQLYPNRIITAYIKDENIPSIKTFEKAGFHFKENCIVEGSSSKRYTI